MSLALSTFVSVQKTGGDVDDRPRAGRNFVALTAALALLALAALGLRVRARRAAKG
jgi:hypothetical protein